jgi:hypothetical protein
VRGRRIAGDKALQLSHGPVGRRPLSQSDYGFLLGRSIDGATLARARDIARRCGVHPHEVLIANGWLRADAYYRALAQACGLPFKGNVTAAEVTPPTPDASPRECLAGGLLKDRTGRFVLAPDRLTPNVLRDVLARLRPNTVSLASPQAVRRAIYAHLASRFAHGAVEGLAVRFPEQSARAKLAAWQIIWLGISGVALAAALAIWPLATIRVVSLGLALNFVPVIGLRLIAACDLLRDRRRQDGEPRAPDAHVSDTRISDAELPVYTILVPLYREAKVLGREASDRRRVGPAVAPSPWGWQQSSAPQFASFPTASASAIVTRRGGPSFLKRPSSDVGEPMV